MTREIVGTALVLVVTVGAVVVAWRSAARKDPAQRSGKRWTRAALALLVVGPLALLVVNSGLSEGDELCLRCGRTRHVISFMRIPIPFLATDSPHGTDGRAYIAAFPAGFVRGHHHTARRIGCHRSGVWLWWKVSCYTLGHSAWHRDLPLITDRDLATKTAARFASLPEEGRSAVLKHYPSAWSTDQSPDERFTSWRARWLRDHPSWP